MITSTLTSKGQITLPVDVRRRLGLEQGDRVSFDVRGDGVVELRREGRSLLASVGLLKPSVRGVTVEQMEAAVLGEAARRHDEVRR